MALFAVTLTGFLAGCDSDSKSNGSATACSNDDDCPAQEECVITAASVQQPVVFNPCVTLVPCTDSSTCAGEMVCAPYTPNPSQPGFNCPAKICQPRCVPASCASDRVCGDDGVCRLLKCDEPNAPACAPHYRCDPAAAPAAVTSVVNGSIVTDAPDPQLEAQRGCVRRLCDDPEGFVCQDNWSCDPAKAPMNEGSGCAPLSCNDTGKCRDDAYSICEPENDGPRGQGTDVHGCVPRNCGEGRDCEQLRSKYAYCDLDAPNADTYGCVVRSCVEVPEACTDGRICDPGGPLVNVYGCRLLTCNDPGGPACSGGAVCQLVNPTTGAYACREPSSGGSGGSGGNAGTTGSGGTRPPAGGAAGASSGGTGGATLVPVTGGRTSTPGTGGRTAATGGSNAAPPPSASGICVARD